MNTNLTKLRLNAKILIHNALASFTWSRLWFFCRGLDSEGTGKVVISISEMATLFEVNNSSIYRWLYDGRREGAFRRYRRRGFFFEVWLGSKAVVTRNLGLSDWGTTGIISVKDLVINHVGSTKRKPTLKKLATEIEADANQRRSRTAAKLSRKKGDKRKTLDPRGYFGANDESSSMNLQAAKIQFIAGSKAFCKPSFVPIGGSQATLATKLGVSDRTIRRRLERVDRVQLMYPVSYDEWWAAAMNDADEGTFKQKDGDQCWRYGCNIYDLDYDLKRETTQRLKYKFDLLNFESERDISFPNETLSLIQDLRKNLKGIGFNEFCFKARTARKNVKNNPDRSWGTIDHQLVCLLTM